MLAAAMVVTMLPVNIWAGTSSANGDGTFKNPAVYSDVPDIDIIRVGDAYYMVSTTMHLSPGCPIMKSTDLVNWEIVNYVYDILGDDDAMSLRNGESMYGNGQWAASLQYHDGLYYVAFNSNTTGTAYLYTTDDIERGAWKKTTLNGPFHDMALFFDDDNEKAYVVYGGGAIKCAELSEDLTTVNKETEKVLFDVTKDEGETHFTEGLLCEGTHIMKKDGYYYVFNISWPSGKPRVEICHRSETFPSTEWENKIILETNFTNNGVGGGVAQGGVIDTADGKWYGFLFQDHGAIGRVPVLTDCTWKDGWPMLGKDGDGKTVEAVMELPVSGSSEKTLVKSDEFYNDAEHRVFDADSVNTASAELTVNEGYTAEAPVELSDDGDDGSPYAPAEVVDLVGNGDFENGSDGWAGFEGGSIEVIEEGEGHVLHVKERTGTASSAKYDLSGKLSKGTTYTVSGKLKYTEGPDTKSFNATFQNGEDYRYRSIGGEIQAEKGTWKEFSIQYTAGDKVDGENTYPFSTTQNYLFFETPWTASPTAENDWMDYYLDDITVTYEKTGGDEGGGDEGDKDDSGDETDDSLIQLFTNGGAETGDTTGWTTTPGEKCGLAAVDADKATGTYSMQVTNRNGTGAGACQDISGKLVMGKTYTVSGKLKYTTGPDTKQFIVTIQNGVDYNYRENVVKINAVKGEWVEFTGTYTPRDKSDKYPFDPEHNYIFVETGWVANATVENDLMDYYLDDFSMTTTSDNMIKNGSFEKGTDNWTGFEKANIAVSKAEAQDGTQSIVTTGRTACAQGPSQDLSNRLTPGNTYTITAYVKYTDGVDQKKFNVTIQNGPDYTYRTNLGSVTANKDEWTKLQAVWTMPDDAITDQNYLFFETPWAASPTADNDLMDFYVDNVSMIEQINDPKVSPEAGENDYNGSDLDLVWQWNHNPNNLYWSLTDRSGWLRLTTGSKATGLLDARNTLTQRTYGPTCSGKIKMDISNMKAGDVAGLASLSYNYGYIAVKKDASGAKLVMVDASQNSVNKADQPVEQESVDCTGNTVYLKEDFNFAGNSDGSEKDTVSFYYSFDGTNWAKLGTTMKMTYELTHFMGSRFAIFNYATKTPGGYVDYDYFRVSDQITGEDSSEANLKAAMTAASEISGVINSECEAKLSMNALEAGDHSSLKASVSIPDIMSVEDVEFNTEAIRGETDYTYKNHRLILTVEGDDISFAAEDELFATIKLKLNNYVDEDKAVDIKADYVMVDNGALDYDVTDCKASVQLNYLDTKALAKKLGYGNPIFTQAFGADPYAMEYDGRVYVYMTADAYQYDENGNVIENDYSYINTLRVVSSSDLMNWTDHGEIAVAGENGAAKWATCSWAPAIAHKEIDGKEKFFLYFANGGSGIGVLEGDSPLGPWRDPLGECLLGAGKPGCDGVVWCFDPAVLVDDKGDGYIFFGGGVPSGDKAYLNPKTARVAKLTDDMVHIDEDKVEMIDSPCMFEDSGIFQYNGKYYYSYCSNFTGPRPEGYPPNTGSICYMVSDDPMGPYEYAGEIFDNPSVWFGTGGNNHHATFVFEGESYFTYHAQTVSKAQGIQQGYRSTHIDKIEMNKDGSIKPIKGTYAGIEQLHEMNPYERIDAETIAWNAGVQVAQCAQPGKIFEDYNTALTDLQDGDWTSVAELSFGENGADEFEAYAASENGGEIEIRLDSPEGSLIGTLKVPATGSDETYQKVSCKVDHVTGTRNVFLVFKGTAEGNLMNVDYYQFTEKEAVNPDDGNKPDDDNKPDDTNKPDDGNKPGDINQPDGTVNPGGTTNPGETTNPDAELQQYVNKKFTAAKLKYTITACSTKEKTVTVTGSSKKLTKLTIPATVKYKGMTFKVTAVAKKAFKNQKKLTKVTVGKNVVSIGSEAFSGAKKLGKIEFSGTAVKSIGKNAFKNIKKSAVFDVKNSKISYYKKLLKKAKTKNFKVK